MCQAKRASLCKQLVGSAIYCARVRGVCRHIELVLMPDSDRYLALAWDFCRLGILIIAELQSLSGVSPSFEMYFCVTVFLGFEDAYEITSKKGIV